jgi:hypothetical protein
VSDNPCPLCGKPIADTAYVCHHCGALLALAILRTALLWESLEDAIGRRLRVDHPSAAPKLVERTPHAGPWCYGAHHGCQHESCRTVWYSRDRTEPPLPHEDSGTLSIEASEAGWAAHNTITTWARHIIETRGLDTPRTPQGACNLLARNAAWLAHRPEAGEAFDELTAAAYVVRATVDTHAARIFLGPCDQCRRDLYAQVGKAEVECKPCMLIYPVQARRELLLTQAEDRLERAVTIAAMLTTYGEPINASRIRQWAKRGRIEQRGSDWSGHPLYRIGDALHLMRAMPETTHGKAS